MRVGCRVSGRCGLWPGLVDGRGAARPPWPEGRLRFSPGAQWNHRRYVFSRDDARQKDPLLPEWPVFSLAQSEHQCRSTPVKYDHPR